MNKFTYLIMAVMMLTACIFSGCSLVTTNQQKYMSQVVANANGNGTTIEVTMEEFLTYYSNYGPNYIQNGMSNKEATEQVVNMIINRKLFVNYLKNFKENDKNIYTLTNADLNECYSSVYKYIYDRLDSYEAEIMTDWGIESAPKKDDEEEEKKDEFVGRKAFEHDYLVQDNKLVKAEKNKPEDVEVALNPNPFNQYFWQESEKEVSGFTTVGALKKKVTEYSDGFREEEMKRFVKDLSKAEEYKDVDDKTSLGVFNREIERMLEIEKDNKYITKYEKVFNENYMLKGEDILALFTATLNSQKEKYNNEKAYNEAMKSDNTSVYYHPTMGWFNVSHLLIGYDEDQKALLEKWKADVKKGVITKEEEQANIESLRKELKATMRDSEGKNTNVTKSATSILDEVNNNLAVFGNNADAKINAFTDLIYKYTTESSFLTRDFDYAIPLDESFDSMVKPFANASRELQKKGLASVSGLVYTEFGAHIIMFTGMNKNVSVTNNDISLQDLWNVPLKSSSDKNMLDLFASKVTKSEFSTQQNKIIDQLRVGLDIEINKTKLKDFYKK